MLSSIPQVFPFFKKGGPLIDNSSESSFCSTSKSENETSLPLLKVSTDREAYRPGDLINATVEIYNQKCSVDNSAETELEADVRDAIQIENLIVEVKGIEKLDTQWFVTQKPSPGSKQRRGERAFLESTPTSIISEVTLSSQYSKTYMIRMVLPKVLPPSYRGTTVRYLYYLVVAMNWRPGNFDNGLSHNQFTKKALHLEARNPLHIWAMPSNSLMNDEGQSKEHLGANGIVPASPLQVEIFWKEKENDSDWARANEMLCGTEDDYASLREETPFNAVHRSLDLAFDRSLVLQSPAMTPRSVSKENSLHYADRSSFASFRMVPQLTPMASETVYETPGGASSQYGNHADRSSFEKKRSLWNVASGSHVQNSVHQHPGNSDVSSSTNGLEQQMEPSNIEPVIGALPPEGFIRGRSYNIRIDEQVLVRFSPKNCDATYYFGDMIGGVLTFFHEEGPRRCLEVSVTLETQEAVSPLFIHPSRKHSPVITKIQSDYHEVVSDMVQTQFMFSIPMDGPMSFSTPHVSLQWVLRFEFVTTPKHVDWTKYEHPLLIEERDKGEWILPITVHAPLPRTHVSLTRKGRTFSPNGFWVGSPGPSGRSQTELSFLSGFESSKREDGTLSYDR